MATTWKSIEDIPLKWEDFDTETWTAVGSNTWNTYVATAWTERTTP